MLQIQRLVRITTLRHPFTNQSPSAAKLTTLFFTIYRYPYPIFEILTPAWRAALFVGSALVMTLSTATLKWLYGRVNGYGIGTPPRARPGAVKG